MLGDERYLYLGFHGCEKQLAMEILLQKKDFHQSTNDYDWLGSGIYFWENVCLYRIKDNLCDKGALY